MTAHEVVTTVLVIAVFGPHVIRWCEKHGQLKVTRWPSGSIKSIHITWKD